jgi:hypothetical protein
MAFVGWNHATLVPSKGLAQGIVIIDNFRSELDLGTNLSGRNFLRWQPLPQRVKALLAIARHCDLDVFGRPESRKIRRA